MFSKGYQGHLKDLIKKWHLYKKCNMKLQSFLQLESLYLWDEYLTTLESSFMNFTNLWPMKFQSCNLLEDILGKDPCMPALILFFPGSSLLVTAGSRAKYIFVWLGTAHFVLGNDASSYCCLNNSAGRLGGKKSHRWRVSVSKNVVLKFATLHLVEILPARS